MRVRLSIAEGGAPSSHVFGKEGGSFGRASRNQWVLPDAERVLSAVHGKVVFRGGGFLLVDESTNGIFPLGWSATLGRNNSVALAEGFRFKAGRYTIRAELIHPSRIDAPQHLAQQVITAADSAQAGVRAALFMQDAHGRVIGQIAPDALSLPAPAVHTEPRPEGREIIPADFMSRMSTQRLPAKSAMTLPKAGAGPATEKFADALFDSMGLKNARILDGDHIRLANLVGALAREMVSGLIQLMSPQSVVRSQFDLDEISGRPSEENPLRRYQIPELVLDEMLVRRGVSFQDPAEAVRTAFAEIEQRTSLSVAATRRAMELLLKRLAPDRIAKDDRKDAQRKFRAFGKRKHKWQTYVELHARLSANTEGMVHEIVAEAFAQVQEEHARSKPDLF